MPNKTSRVTTQSFRRSLRKLSFRQMLAHLLSLLLILQSAATPLGTVSASSNTTSQAAGIVLTPVTTTFNNLTGLAYHQTNNKLLAAVNAPTGQPRNFEQLAADGSHAPFSNVGGLSGELRIATARNEGQGQSLGGFAPGEAFCGTSAPGVIARLSATGAAIQNPWVNLPQESGRVTSLHLDRTGLYNGHVIAVTATGKVWRVNAQAQATLVANLNTPLSGVTTLPNAPEKYGPWAGKILVGAPLAGLVYAVDAQGASTFQNFGINPSELLLIPAHENFFGVDPASQKIWGAPDDAFTGFVDDILVAQTAPGKLGRLQWNGASFEYAQLAEVAEWRQIAFAPAGLAPIADAGRFYDQLAVVRRAPTFNSGRVEGALWQLTGEALTLDGTDTITADLLVPGTPAVQNSSPNFGGVIQGTGSIAPSGYPISLAGQAAVRNLVTRIDPITLEPVNPPPDPIGTRDVSLSGNNQSPGDWATLRNLSLSGNSGPLAVPPGTYGAFSTAGNSVLVLGVAGAAQPVTYNLQALTLAGNSELRIVGLVILVVKTGVTLTGGTVGEGNNPQWLQLRIAQGGLNLSGNSVLYGTVRAPQGLVSLAGRARLRGTAACDRLTIDGNSILQVTESAVPAPPINRAPLVDAGADQTITLPTNNVSLQGTAIDDGLPTGAALVYSWTKLGGPGGVAFSNQQSLSTTATFTAAGTYHLRLTVSDSLLLASDDLVVTVVQQNQAPSVNAGPDQTISLPTDTVNLAGAASDDGLPQGSTLTYQWTKVSGPGAVTFGSATSAATTASFSTNGTYVVRLTVSDSQLSGTDDVTIYVNRAPLVNAGPDKTIDLPNSTASLTGTVADDGLPPGAALTQTWTKVSGPGAVTFSNAAALTTNATFSQAGVYVLRLTVSDTLLSASDDAQVTVNAQNQAPLVNAGADQTISLPTNSVNLSGTATDDGLPAGATLTYAWTRASGPGTVIFSAPNAATTTATFSVNGVYTLRLTVSDSLLSGFDEMNITVNQAPQVNAGPDKLITLPTNTVSLTGAAPDDGLPAGSSVSVTWTKLSGPGAVTFSAANNTATNATFSLGGVYVLRLTATDGLAAASDDVQVTVNQAPIVNAGLDRTIALPTNTVALQGTANDDGLPQGSTLTYAWTAVSGPGSVVFSTPGAAATNATFAVAGTYILRLTVSDSAATGSDEVAVTVLPRNQAPQVNAGTDQTLVFPTLSTFLNGVVNDDGLPQGAPLTVAWSKLSGPGTVTLGNPNAAATTAAFSQAGVYVLRLTASDTEFTVSDDVVVTINLNNQAPTVNAGPDQTIVTPTNSISLFGAVTDDGQPAGLPLLITWTQVSGPAQASFGNPGAAVTTATFNAQGVYVLRLTAHDGQFSASDEVQVTVGCSESTRKLDVALVIDLSGSFAGQPLADAKNASKQFIDQLQLTTNDQVSVVSFAATATLDQPLTRDGALAKAKIDALTVNDSGTAIATGINAAKDELNGPRHDPQAARIMILLSDGQESLGSFPTFAAAAAKATGIRLITVTFGALGNICPSCMREMASSGTDTFFAPNSADLAKIYGYIAGAICRNQEPLANAGPDRNVVLPATGMLQGSASDDGVPVNAALTATWTQVSGPAPAVLLSPSAPQTTAVFTQAGTYVFRLTVTDTLLTASDDVTVNVLTEPSLTGATFTLTTTNQSANETGTPVTVKASLRDNLTQPIANLGLRFTVTGANAANVVGATGVTATDGTLSFTYTGANAGTDTIIATAQNSTQTLNSNQLTFNWTAAPAQIPFTTQGWLAAPVHQTTVSGLVPVTLAAGVTLATGKLEVCKDVDAATCTTVANNVSGAPGATIGVIDTTQLANGPWIIRLTGTNSTGQQLLSQVLVTAVGENKPGRLTLKINEFTVPVSGVPITIARRYDSLERGLSGDFGFGWALDVYAVRLEAAPDHDVTITDPNTGRRVTFDFVPRSFGGLMSFLYEPKYAAEPGFYGTLTSDGCGLMYFSGRQFRCALDTAYQPTTYTYTDPYGRRFTMGADGKLRSLKDLHGNTLTVTPTGITSSAGNKAVSFVRDAQGRITRITDPGNRAYQYGYNAAGELLNVTLPGVTTQPAYTYNAQHHLLTAKDARGNIEATLTYHPDGRIASVTDASSNTTSYAYDLANNVSTQTNPDAGVSTRRYDGYGMLLSETDALGKTMTYAYDAQHNKLSETNALNQTTSYTYDSSGHQTSMTDAQSQTSRFSYNQFGGPVTLTDQVGNTRTVLYDGQFAPTEIRDNLGLLARFTIDSHGSPISLTDGNGGTRTYSYDQFGNKIAEGDPLNINHHWNYDDMGRATKHTLPAGNEEFFSYDPLGRQTRYSRGGYFMDYENDANGARTAQTDPLNHRTVYSYDAANRLTQITYPDTTTISYTYNFRGQKLTETNQLGRTTTYTYDQAGRLTKIKHPNNNEQTMTYDAIGRLLSQTDERGNTTTYQHDLSCGCANRVTKITDARGKTTEYKYDGAGRRTAFIDANGRETKYVYDARNRLTQTIFPDNTTVSSTYDGANRELTRTDQAGKVTRYAYDLAGNLTSVTNALNQQTSYLYDPNRNLTRIIDARGDVMSFSHTGLDELYSRGIVGNEGEYFTYDGARNLKTRQYGTGQITTYNYDALNRLTSKVPHASLNEPTSSFTYTATGQRQTMTDGSGTTVYGYDTRERLTSRQTPFGTLTYGYDAASNVASVQSSNANGVSLSYGYDALNRLQTVTDNRLSPGLTSYVYDDVGNLQQTVQPNGVQADYLYNNLNLLTTQTTSKGASTLARYGYTYKPTRHRQSMTELHGRTVNYGYDDVYKLTSETITGAPIAAQNGAVSYTYDVVGNRLTRTSTLAGLGNQSFSYHGGNKVVGDGYTPNGATTAADGQTYAYNFEDRIKSANNGAISIIYDGDGNRVSKTVGGVTTNYLVDTNNPTGYAQVVEELVGGQVRRAYSYGAMLISQRQLVGASWVTSHYGYDGSGNVRQLFDNAGAVTDTFDYDAFGNLIARTGTTANSYLYRGQQFDADLGFYYQRARYYGQQRGRFWTVDPHQGEQKKPITLHKYLYANADPVNLFDPSGLLSTGEAALINAYLTTRLEDFTKIIVISGCTILDFVRVLDRKLAKTLVRLAFCSRFQDGKKLDADWFVEVSNNWDAAYEYFRFTVVTNKSVRDYLGYLKFAYQRYNDATDQFD